MVEKIQTDVDRLILVLKLKKCWIIARYIGTFFLLSKPKVVYLRLFLSSLTFPTFWKQNFVYFGHKHIENVLYLVWWKTAKHRSDFWLARNEFLSDTFAKDNRYYGFITVRKLIFLRIDSCALIWKIRLNQRLR